MIGKASASTALFICVVVHPVHAQDSNSAALYGVDEFAVSEKEKKDDLPFGGYPNSRLFNNDRLCKAATSSINTALDGNHGPVRQAFIEYARVSLMVMDIAFSTMRQAPRLIEHIGPAEWRALPVLYRVYCDSHPGETLMDATSAVYTAARHQAGL